LGVRALWWRWSGSSYPDYPPYDGQNLKGKQMFNFPETIKIDVHLHGEGVDQNSGLSAKLDIIIAMLDDVLRKEHDMSVQLDTLTTQVKANTDAEASAVLLLQGLSAQIAAIKTDPVALQTLSDELKTSADALAAAVVANTPAA